MERTQKLERRTGITIAVIILLLLLLAGAGGSWILRSSDRGNGAAQPVPAQAARIAGAAPSLPVIDSATVPAADLAVSGTPSGVTPKSRGGRGLKLVEAVAKAPDEGLGMVGSSHVTAVADGIYAEPLSDALLALGETAFGEIMPARPLLDLPFGGGGTIGGFGVGRAGGPGGGMGGGAGGPSAGGGQGDGGAEGGNDGSPDDGSPSDGNDGQQGDSPETDPGDGTPGGREDVGEGNDGGEEAPGSGSGGQPEGGGGDDDTAPTQPGPGAETPKGGDEEPGTGTDGGDDGSSDGSGGEGDGPTETGGGQEPDEGPAPLPGDNGEIPGGDTGSPVDDIGDELADMPEGELFDEVTNPGGDDGDMQNPDLDLTADAVPAPGAMVLFGTAVVAAGMARKRRRQG